MATAFTIIATWTALSFVSAFGIARLVDARKWAHLGNDRRAARQARKAQIAALVRS